MSFAPQWTPGTPPYASADYLWAIPEKYVNHQWQLMKTIGTRGGSAVRLDELRHRLRPPRRPHNLLLVLQSARPGQPLGDVKLGMRLQFPNGQSVLISTKDRIEVDRPIVLLDAWYQEPWNASLHEDFLSSYVALDSPQMSFSPQVRSPYAGVANYVQLVSADNASDYYPYSQNTEGEYVLDNVDPYKGDIPISPDARCSVLFDDAPRFQEKYR